MMHILATAVFFSTFLMVSHAHTNSLPAASEVCNKLMPETGRSKDGLSTCEQVVGTSDNRLYNACVDFAEKLGSAKKEDVETLLSECRTTVDAYKNYHSSDTDAIRSPFKNNRRMRSGAAGQAAGEAATREQVATNPVVSSTLSACMESINKPCLLPQGTFNFNMNFTMFQLYTPGKAVALKDVPDYSPELCNCIKTSLNHSEFAGSVNVRMAEEKRRVRDEMLKAAGRKIVNAFASNMEDVLFFRTNNMSALGSDKRTKDLLCNDVGDIQRKIKSRCSKDQLAHAEPRIKTLLESMGGTKVKDLRSGLKEIEEDIRFEKLDPKNIDPKNAGQVYSREQYDRARYGLYKKSPEVEFMTELTAKVMEDPKLSGFIDEKLKSNKWRPGEAIISIMLDKKNPSAMAILQDLVESHKDSPFYLNLKPMLTTPLNDLGPFLADAYDIATDMHPTIKAVFTDKKLFAQARKKLSRNNHSLMEAMEQNPGYLAEHYEEKCEKFIEDFAEAVCTPDDQLLTKVNAVDLNNLLSATQTDDNVTIKDALICEMTANQSYPDSVWNNLAFSLADKIDQADYYLRKVTPESESTFTRFANMTYGRDKDAAKYMEAVTSFGNSISQPAPEFLKRMATNDLSEKTPNTTTQDILKAVQANLNPVEGEAAGQKVNLAPVYSNAATQSSPPPQYPDSKSSESKNDPKDLLREFLNGQKSRDVEKYLADAKPEDLERLNSLREELENNKSKLQDLLKENQNINLKAMRDKVEKLQSQVQEEPKMERTANNVVRDAQPSQGGLTGATSGSAGGSFQASSARSTSVSSEGRSPASIPVPVQTPGSSQPSINSGGSPSGALILVSNVVRQDEKGAREDLSQEVISYVEGKDLDLASLKSLKETGIILKYKIVEGGKEIEKEIRLEYASMTEEAKKALDRRIAYKQKKDELTAAKRSYSYAALKIMLGIEAQKRTN